MTRGSVNTRGQIVGTVSECNRPPFVDIRVCKLVNIRHAQLYTGGVVEYADKLDARVHILVDDGRIVEVVNNIIATFLLKWIVFKGPSIFCKST